MVRLGLNVQFWDYFVIIFLRLTRGTATRDGTRYMQENRLICLYNVFRQPITVNA